MGLGSKNLYESIEGGRFEIEEIYDRLLQPSQAMPGESKDIQTVLKHIDRLRSKLVDLQS